MIDNLYDQLGSDTISALVAAFYRQIPADDLMGPMYDQNDFEGAETRLRDFLIFRLGRPRTYLENRGHPALRMRHAPFAIDLAARDRWMELMTAALNETIADEAARQLLHDFLGQVATAMINVHAPQQ